MFTTAEAFEAHAVDVITSHLREQLQNHDHAELFLSGGSTPGPIYHALSRQNLAWDKVLVGQVDERWVPLSDNGSNGALVRRTLLRNNAAPAQFIRMKSRHKTAKAGLESLEADYTSFQFKPAIAILGMGPDGHTAGWFPDSSGIGEALNPETSRRVVAIQAKPSPVTGSYLERITLTLSALRACNALLVLTKGADKLEVLQQAVTDRPDTLPISHLLNVAGHKMTCLHLDN